MIHLSDSNKNKKFNNKPGRETLDKLLTFSFVHFYFNVLEYVRTSVRPYLFIIQNQLDLRLPSVHTIYIKTNTFNTLITNNI